MRVGIIGAGQLGRMLAQSGMDLGINFSFLDPAMNPCAELVGDHVQADYDDMHAVKSLFHHSDVVTFEFENVDLDALRQLEASTNKIRPALDALAVSQQRVKEKRFFEYLNVKVAPWAEATDQESLAKAIDNLGVPVIVKTDRLGYDGKGQRRITDPQQVPGLFEAMGNVPLCVESVVEFDGEVSIIGTRSVDGSIKTYDLSENVHRDGILYQTTIPSRWPELHKDATTIFKNITDAFDYIGTLTIEFFVKDNQLIANELAPRVHNSGHWTIEGAVTSQFENHVRAICGLPLGETDRNGFIGMRNFVGDVPPLSDSLTIPRLAFHDYCKEPRPGRKVGHATLVCNTSDEVKAGLEALDQIAPWQT